MSQLFVFLLQLFIILLQLFANNGKQLQQNGNNVSKTFFFQIDSNSWLFSSSPL